MSCVLMSASTAWRASRLLWMSLMIAFTPELSGRAGRAEPGGEPRQSDNYNSRDRIRETSALYRRTRTNVKLTARKADGSAPQEMAERHQNA